MTQAVQEDVTQDGLPVTREARQAYYAAIHKASGGVVQTPQDLRDYTFGSIDPDNKYCGFEWDVSGFASQFSLLAYTSARHDQGAIGSCVSNGYAKLVETQLNYKSASPLEISRLFIYWNARKRLADALGRPIIDGGSSIFIAAAEMTKKGMALESICPYIEANVNIEPGASAFADGLLRMVNRYERIGVNTFNPITHEAVSRDLVRDVKVALNNGMPVVFGCGLTSAFYGVYGPLHTHTTQFNPTGFIHAGTPGYIGGHCMVIVGYDDVNQWFIVENSWGTNWGDNGLIAMSYQAVAAINFDMFVIREFMGYSFDIPSNLRVMHPKQRVVSWDFDGLPGQVYRLYQAAFNRRPDWDGLGYQIYYADPSRQGLTTVANNFTASPEYLATFGNTTDYRFIELCYLLALYRAGSHEEIMWHVNRMQTNNLTRGEMLLGFSESAENKANCLYVYGAEGIKYYPYTPTPAGFWARVSRFFTG